MSVSEASRVIAAAGILLTTVAACGSASDTAAPPSPSIEPASVPAPPSTTGTPWCITAALHISLGHGEGAAGHFYVPIRFTNTGTPCGITGYPGVSYFAGADHHQVGDAAVPDPGPVPRLVLQPGQSASAWVDQVNVDNYDPALCGPQPVTGLRVYAPGNTVPVLLPQPGARACTQHMEGRRTLAVQAVQGGTG
ncbi:hypothetical protein GCM10027258_39870 [Amycolatopsis stemonae]